MRPITALVASSVLASSLLALGGCVPQSQYDELMNAHRSKEQQLLQLQGEYDVSRANEDALRRQLAQAAADLAAAQQLAGSDKGTLDELSKKYQDLLAKLEGMSFLPERVNQLLIALAEQYPDVFEYDAKLGMLRFKSDVTFDLGSAKLTSKAETVIAKFGEILNTADARDLEVQVVGHTDNVPIRKGSTAAQHPTNMHLSAHRSISVRDALVSDGVSANRFLVSGYGEFRPIAANGPRGNAENRRVEVYLRPMPANVAIERVADVKPASTTPSPTATAIEPDNLK